jgi:hypothetical protein
VGAVALAALVIVLFYGAYWSWIRRPAPAVAGLPRQGLVAVWSGNGNANDLAGANHGDPHNISYAHSEVGPAFVFNGYSSVIRVPASPSLDVGQAAGLTIAAWINPKSLNFQDLFEWNQDNGRVFGSEQIGTHMEIDDVPGDGTLWGNLVDTTGVAHGFASGNGVIVAGQFQHVALTYDKSTGVAVLYRNGVALATKNLGVFTPQTGYDFFMGDRVSGFYTGIHFQGQMAEPAIYRRLP